MRISTSIFWPRVRCSGGEGRADAVVVWRVAKGHEENGVDVGGEEEEGGWFV